MADFTSKLKIDISEFIASLQQAASKTGVLGSALKGSMDAGKQSTQAMQAALKDLEKSGQGSSASADKLRESLAKADKEATGLEQSVKGVSSELSKANGGALSGLVSKFKEGQAAAGSGGGMFGSLAGTLGSLASPVGAATAALGVLTAGIGASINIGKEFETGMQSLSAVTGLSGAPLDDLGKRARDLAKQFGGSAKDQLESFQGVLSKFGPQLAGTPEALSEVSKNVNILAKAGTIDAAQAMDTLANSMLQFGVNVEDGNTAALESARFINVLAASAKQGASEIPQVGQAVLVAGVAAKGANVSFEETNAAIQVLAVGGKQGAEAGTALRNVLGKIAGEDVVPKEAAAKLKALGVDFNVLGDTSKPLSARLAELAKAQKDSTAIAQLFGTENAGAANILIDGAGKMKDWTAAITGTNEATEAAQKNMATFSEAMSRLKANVEDVGISVYQFIAPALTFLADAFSNLFSGEGNSFLQPLIDGFKKAYDALKPIVDLIIKGVIVYLQVQFEQLKTVLGVVFGVIGDTFDRLAVIIAPLVAKIKELFGGVGEGISVVEIAKTVFGALATVLDVALRVALGIITSLFSVVVNVITATIGVISEVIKWVKSAASSFMEWVNNTKFLSDALKIAGDGFKGFIDGVSKVKDAVLGFLGLNGSKVEVSADVKQGTDFKAINSEFNKLFGQVEKFGNDNAKESDKIVQIKKKEFKSTLDEQIKAGIAANTITESQAKDLQARLDKIHGKVTIADKEDDADKKKQSALQKLQATFKEYSDAQNLAAEKIAVAQKEKAIADGRATLNASEELAVQTAILEARKNVAAEAKKTFGVPIKLDAGETRTQVDKIITDAQGAFAEQTMRVKKISIDDAKADIEKNLQTLLSDAEFTIEVIGQKGIERASADATQIIANLRSLADDALAAGDEKQSAAILKKADKLEADKLKITTAYIKRERDVRINAIVDPIEREKAKKVAALQDETDALEEELRTQDGLTQESTNARVDLIKQNAARIKAMLITNEKSTLSELATQYVDFLQKNLAANQEAIREENKAKAEAGKKADEELAALKTSLAKREISYAEYSKKLESIDEERADATKDTESKVLSTKKILLNTLAQTLDEKSKKDIDKLGKDVESKTATVGQALTTLGGAAVSTFATMTAAGKSTGDAILGSLLKTAQQAIAIYTPQILAAFTAMLGPFGMPAGLAAIATVEALLASASGGFKEGGYTGHGNSDAVAGVVHRGEWVTTAGVTARERPILEWMHRGGSSADFYRPSLSDTSVAHDGSMHTGLMVIANRLERVEKAINKTAARTYRKVDLEVMHDPSLSIKAHNRSVTLTTATR